VQAAARLDANSLCVQVCRSPQIPDLPTGFEQEAYLPITAEKYARFCEKIIIRPVKLLSADLSPARILLDLHGLHGVEVRSRFQDLGDQFDPFSDCDPPANAKWNKKALQYDLPIVSLLLVGHFLRADFFRIFGRTFLNTLRPQPMEKHGAVAVRSRKLLSFVEVVGKRPRTDPTLEFLVAGDDAFAVRLKTRDTALPFGRGSLEAHSQTFIGIGKSDTLSEADKKDMLKTFQTRTADAYGYAYVDAINTLLVYEAMVAKDKEISKAFGLPEQEG
jgi:hypothetical protein